MSRYSRRRCALLLGTAGLSLSVLFAGDADAQNRPASPTRRAPASPSTGSRDAVSSPNSKPAAPSVQAPRPKSDIMDLLDRGDDASGSERAVPGVVTCVAGCDGAPGKIVYAALVVRPAEVQPIQKAALIALPDVPAETVPTAGILCVAGCFNEPDWKRYSVPWQPAVVVASLNPPTAGVRSTAPPASRSGAKAKHARVTSKAHSPVAVRTAALGSLHAAPPARTARHAARAQLKYANFKRPNPKAKRRAMVRKMQQPLIVAPSNAYPPRPLHVVRSAEAVAAPSRKPQAPTDGFVTKVSLAKPEEHRHATPTAQEVARRAARDPDLRSTIAAASDDWLNKAKRDAAPAIRVQ